MFLMMIGAVLAGWSENGEDGGCRFFTGSPDGSVTPLRAECDWQLPPEKLQAAIADFGRHDDYFTSVVESTVVSPGLARQVHQASGISNRAVMVKFWTEEIPSGKRYSWARASDQAPVTDLGVVPIRDDGKWEVTPGAGGGSHVVYELYYDPGGSVPGFIVRAFQGSGFRTLVLEMKAWVSSH